jgi:hypothetical protein
MDYTGVNTDDLQASLATIKRFQTDLGEFEGTLLRLQEGRYGGNDWMIGQSPSVVELHGREAVDALSQIRDRILRDKEQVTRLCQRYGLPYVWRVTPAPAFGGLIKDINIFHAFIDLELESSARPSLLKVNDLVKHTIWQCEKEIEEVSTPKPFNPGRKLAGLSDGISSILGWLFPSEKQRLVVGWLIIVTMVGLMLRYVFGFHMDDIGKLVVKWAFNK